MTDAPVTKWVCEYCTYENYPSALKCTMCRGAKPLLGENIFHLRKNSSLSSEEDTTPVSGAAVNDLTQKKEYWQCCKCTRVNWSLPGSECNECHTSNKLNINSAIEQLQEQLRPLRIESNEASFIKWSCPNCTYDNWPKATKCVMCGAVSRSSNEMEASNFVDSNSLTNSKRPYKNEDSPASPKSPSNNCDTERRIRQRQPDLSWLNACIGVVQGDHSPVESFLSSGGDPTRQLTASEVTLLNRPSAFDTGYTLVHLAIRFHREDMLATLLSRIEGSGSGVKRVPSYVAPELASDIRQHAASTIRQRKCLMPCPFVSELTTFSLPAEIEELPGSVQEKLFDELLDKDAQQQLEAEPPIINWSLEVTVHLGSRLYALWNRSAGDCLLDSLMQTTWGVFDRDNMLRNALADSLNNSGHMFYPRWREYESSQARLLHFSLEEAQWKKDWAGLITLASQPGASLDQLHVFALAHILRRPIIVYGVKCVKSFRGEDLGFARFEGVYLPFLWETSFCSRSPLALGYTRGHFSALVPIEPYSSPETGANNQSNQENLQVTFLPLMDYSRKLLPVHFLIESEVGQEERMLRQWLDVCVTEGGLLVAQQRLTKRPLIVAQMLEEWLNHYRRIAQILRAPYCQPKPVQNYSSDGDTDDESQFPEFSK